jgi:Holliday junction resolvasome RuvABC endonuclease subunit
MLLAIDPSGNFNEGKGISGWVLMTEDTGKVIKFGAIDASTSMSFEQHCDNHMKLIEQLSEKYPNTTVIVEDYFLYANRAATQINSRMETPKLLGVIQYFCYKHGIKLQFQTAVSVQRRWKDFLLVKQGFMTTSKYMRQDKEYTFCYINGFKVNNHVVDALRHAVHYYRFQCGGKPNVTEGPEDHDEECETAD